MNQQSTLLSMISPFCSLLLQDHLLTLYLASLTLHCKTSLPVNDTALF